MASVYRAGTSRARQRRRKAGQFRSEFAQNKSNTINTIDLLGNAGVEWFHLRGRRRTPCGRAAGACRCVGTWVSPCALLCCASVAGGSPEKRHAGGSVGRDAPPFFMPAWRKGREMIDSALILPLFIFYVARSVMYHENISKVSRKRLLLRKKARGQHESQ